jgi:hypothetical protein
MRWNVGLAALAFAAMAASGAGAQTPSREKVLTGAWTCSVTGVDSIESANAQFEPGGVMLVTFFNNDPNVKMSFVLSGLWSYVQATDSFSHTFRGARVANIAVRGTPVSRADFPGGEAGIEKVETDFMAQYSTSTLAFVKVAETELILTATGNAKLTCGRQGGMRP